jgi:hypothetical protein
MAPQEAPRTALLAVRENVRRARLGSFVILIAIFLAAIALPAALSSPNHLLLLILGGVLTCQISGLLLNRLGKVTAAGILVVIASDVGLMSALWFQPDGFSIFNLPVIDLLIQPTFFAVSLLPPRSVFAVAGINILFVLLLFFLLPHTPDFDHMLATQGYEAMVRPIILQFIVAVITFLWVRSSNMAIQRADRAEQIAQLEHDLAAQAYASAQQKERLEASIKQIITVHTEVANGNFNARVPLTADNVLWEVGGSLNNLLSRIQRLQQSEREMHVLLPRLQRATQIEEQYMRTLHDIEALSKIIQSSDGRPLVINILPRQASIAALLKALNGKIVSSRPLIAKDTLNLKKD